MWFTLRSLFIRDASSVATSIFKPICLSIDVNYISSLGNSRAVSRSLKASFALPELYWLGFCTNISIAHLARYFKNVICSDVNSSFSLSIHRQNVSMVLFRCPRCSKSAVQLKQKKHLHCGSTHKLSILPLHDWHCSEKLVKSWEVAITIGKSARGSFCTFFIFSGFLASFF